MDRCVTISTDFNVLAAELSITKQLLGESLPKSISILDFAHTQYQFNFFEIALFIGRHFHLYEKESIHIILCDIYNNFNACLLLVRIEDHYFIAPNNGILSLIHPMSKWKNVKIIPLKSDSFFGIVKELSHPIAVLWEKQSIHYLSELPLQDCVHFQKQLPNIQSSAIYGQIIYIDGFGNAISNIQKELFDTIAKGRKYNIQFGVTREPITKLSIHYGNAEDGKVLALFNHNQLLEIAVQHGNAARLFGLKTLHDNRLISTHSSDIVVQFFE